MINSPAGTRRMVIPLPSVTRFVGVRAGCVGVGLESVVGWTVTAEVGRGVGVAVGVGCTINIKPGI